MLREDLLHKLEDIARRENRTINEVVEGWIQAHEQEKADAYEEARRKLLPRFIEMARRYWRQVGDEERLALTDEQLETLFWFIDENGIPRLKTDDVEPVEGTLFDLAQAAENMPDFAGPMDVAEHSRYILENDWVDYVVERNRPSDAENPD